MKRTPSKAQAQYYHLVKLSYPSYYVENVVINSVDEELTAQSWSVLMSGTPTEEFKKRRLNPNFHQATSLSWFYDIFYQKFFELTPDAASMFTNVSLVHQGKLLATVIGSALSSLRKPDILKKSLIGLVRSHNAKGVHPIHYCNMGLALFWSLGEVLGEQVFNNETKLSWVKMYSFLLSIIIPSAVKFKLGIQENCCTQEKTVALHMSTSYLRMELSIRNFRASKRSSSKALIHPEELHQHNASS